MVMGRDFFCSGTATNKNSLKELLEAISKYGGTARNILNKSPEQAENEIRTDINNSTDFPTIFVHSFRPRTISQKKRVVH